MYKEELETKLETKPRKEQTCTFYCRGVTVRNKNFALAEIKKLRYRTIGKYIDALLEYRRTLGKKEVDDE
jgi:hypothetical protein